MNKDVIFLILVALAVAWALFAKWRRHRVADTLPSISSEEFLKFFRDSGIEDFPEKILQERRRIAKTLDLPEEKVPPDASFEQLAKNFDFLGDVSVGWSDLEYDLLEEFEDSAHKGKPPSPETVGDYILQMVSLQRQNASEH